MKAVMPARIRGQFPRWGYLDRYATNEDMPRALGLALALTLAAIGVAQLWRTLPPDVTLQMIERPMPHFTQPTDILPPPAIENVGTISPPKAARTRPQIPSFIVVDDEPVIDTDWSTEGSSSGLDVAAGLAIGRSAITEGGKWSAAGLHRTTSSSSRRNQGS
jgi:hypothetical protein